MIMKRTMTTVALLCAGYLASICGASAAFPLAHQDSGFHLTTSLPLDSKEVAFTHEPDFSDHDVVRSAIITGSGPKDFMGFAWDRTAEQLHLDLNRDLDLTNDEDGTFDSEERRSYMQKFDGIRLALDREGVSVPYVVQIYFYSFSGSSRDGYLTVYSGWRGGVELHGKRWTLSVVDNLDGVLNQLDQFRLIPKPEDPTDAVIHAQTLPGATGLHLAGHTYDLGFTFEGEPGASVLAVDATDADVAMGTLNIEGESIARLTLYPESGGYLVVADRPEATLTIPAGTYTGGQTYLNGGEKLVFEARLPGPTIAQDQPASIKTGGPLDNTVVAESRGSVIELDYQLRGAGGEEYRGLNDDRRQAPRFVVHKGPLKLHSGKFEYG